MQNFKKCQPAEKMFDINVYYSFENAQYNVLEDLMEKELTDDEFYDYLLSFTSEFYIESKKHNFVCPEMRICISDDDRFPFSSVYNVSLTEDKKKFSKLNLMV